MATFRDIADSSLEAGAPVSQPLLQALTDNQVAIPAGAQGAPRLKALAITPATSQAQTKDTAVHRARFVVGETQVYDSGTTLVFTPEYFVGRGGNYAVHIVTIGNGISHKAELRKNGSVIQTTSAGTGTVSTWYQLDFAPADKIDVKHVPIGSPAVLQQSAATLIFIYCNNPFSLSEHTHGYVQAYYADDLASLQAAYSVVKILDTY